MQTSVLLSIKPEFVEKIFSGLKRYEFRRVIFKSERVSRVVVYASRPVQRVVGEFEVGGILALNRSQLWRHTRRYSGIAKANFDDYFADKEMAYAIKIRRATRYDEPIAFDLLFPSARPPQSFMYIPSDHSSFPKTVLNRSSTC
jgi:predicted transcriptional regulator